MDFKQAINAHTAWKMKLTNYLKNPDGSMDKEQISKDNLCELGKWIHSDGQQYIKFPEFAELITVHANFHKEIGSIIDKADHTKDLREELVFGTHSEYVELSKKLSHCY